MGSFIYRQKSNRLLDEKYYDDDLTTFKCSYFCFPITEKVYK